MIFDLANKIFEKHSIEERYSWYSALCLLSNDLLRNTSAPRQCLSVDNLTSTMSPSYIKTSSTSAFAVFNRMGKISSLTPNNEEITIPTFEIPFHYWVMPDTVNHSTYTPLVSLEISRKLAYYENVLFSKLLRTLMATNQLKKVQYDDIIVGAEEALLHVCTGHEKSIRILCCNDNFEIMQKHFHGKQLIQGRSVPALRVSHGTLEELKFWGLGQLSLDSHTYFFPENEHAGVLSIKQAMTILEVNDPYKVIIYEDIGMSIIDPERCAVIYGK